MLNRRANFNYANTPHGHVYCSWENNTLHLETEGPFNKEGADEALLQMIEMVKSKQLPKWKRLDITDVNALGNPDVLKVIAKSYFWAFEHGCIAMGLVYCNSLQKILCEDFLKLHPYNIQLFNCISDANSWLETQQ